MTAIAVQNGLGVPVTCMFCALDSSGAITYQTPSLTLETGLSPYDWLYYVDSGLDGAASYAIKCYFTQGVRDWDAWLIPPVQGLDGLLGEIGGAVSIGIGTGPYSPSYGEQLSDGTSVVDSVWSPAASGQQAQFTYTGLYTVLGGSDYPPHPGLLGICATTDSYPTTRQPPCCWRMGGYTMAPPVDGLPQATLAWASINTPYCLSLAETDDVPLSTVPAPSPTTLPDGGGGTASRQGLEAYQKAAANDDSNWWWWVLGVALVLLVVILSGVGIWYWNKSRDDATARDSGEETIVARDR